MFVLRKLFFCLFFLSCILYLGSETFRFNYAKGDSYRILSTVKEDVLVNGKLDHRAEIVNRISVDITETDNLSGKHEAVFMTSQTAVQGVNEKEFVWGTEYKSVFWCSELGEYSMSDEYFMPNARNVPLFPEQDVGIGESWIAQGYEVHDLREIFGIAKPYIIPFSASYTYAGTQSIDGRTLHIIKVQYSLDYANPVPKKEEYIDNNRRIDYPFHTMGAFNQTIYFDNTIGAIHSYNETFRIVIETSLGNFFEYRGTAQSEITELKKVSTPDTLQNVKDSIEKLGIEDTQVSKGEQGITLTLENIQFEADSAVLRQSEKEKLKKIAQILQEFPDHDLLISGHTALAGTAESRMQLSLQRAKSVADFLISVGIKDAYHVFTRGYGAEKPAASNSTAEGMAKNRRVEITILEE